MAEFIQYSEEWKAEIKKLPKNTIIEIASQMGKEKQNEINVLMQQRTEMLQVLLDILPIAEEFINENHPAYKKALSVIKKATE